MAGEDRLREYLKKATADLAEARRREAAADEPLAVVGMACRFPGAPSVDRYWDLLSNGRTGVVDDVPDGRFDLAALRETDGVYTTRGGYLDDIAGWDASFFGASPREALRMDPQQRLLMELTWESLEDAGLPPADLAGSRTAVMIGLSDTLQYGRIQQEREGLSMVHDPYGGQGASLSVAAGRIAYHFDLRGPTMTVDTACSSSLVAVHLAGAALRRGECTTAVVGGGFLMIHRDMYVNACATGMLSRDGLCRTFDARADGYALGEGAGVVVLMRLSDAVAQGRPVHAVIRGTAVNQDGRSNGLTAPNRAAQVDVIRRALAAAGASPQDVSYVEAHGSATRLGDAIELSALGDVFGRRTADDPLLVGAVKTNIGHTQSAAGMAGLIKTILVLKHGTVPPNLNMEQPSPTALAQDGLLPVTTARPLQAAAGQPRLAGVSSFGWCGTNAHVVVAAPAADEAAGGSGAADGCGAAELLLVSAADDDALRARLGDLAPAAGRAPLADLAHTLRAGRGTLEYRRAVAAEDAGQAVRLLERAGREPGVRAAKEAPRIAFLLPGVGDHYRGLGQDLYRREPAFAAAVDRCADIAAGRCDIDLRALFHAEPEPPAPAGDLLGPAAQAADDPDHRAVTSHLLLFTVEYALAELLNSWGVRPEVLVGYSLGEYVAACLAGVFTLEDALWVVSRRARLIEAAPPGGMLAVAAAADRVEAELAGAGLAVEVAALNGPYMTVLSGPPEDVTAAAAHLTAAGLPARPLRSAHAFHSSLLAPARDELARAVASVERRPPTVTVVSNVTGAPLTAEQAMDPGYWADHLTSPVRFFDGLGACAGLNLGAYVELGAGQTLGGLLRQHAEAADGPLITGTLPARWSTDGRPDERAHLLETCGRLWERGADLDRTALGRGAGRLVPLPSYPFRRTRYWPEGPLLVRSAADLTGLTPADHCYAPAWRPDVTASAALLAAPGPLDGPLLVLADPDGVGTRLADLAEAAGTPVLEVVPGTERRRDGRRLVIDPDDPDHHREALAAARALGPGRLHVAHLWSLCEPVRTPPFATDAELTAAIRYGFDALLLTVQVLGPLAGIDGAVLVTATAGAAEVIGRDCTAPERALAHGLARVARAEYPGLGWQGVDLDPEAPADASAAVLLAELARAAGAGPRTSSDHAVAAWRRGRRLRQDWAAVDLPAPDSAAPAAPTAPAFRADGTYLITGGTRGLGLSLARHLVRSGVRRLALVGRTDLRAAAAAEPEGRAAHSLRDVAELEAAGAEVLLLTADVGVPGELRRALGACRERLGAPHGVLHAAGLPARGMTFRLTPGGSRPVLTPKVLAMGPLAELVGPDVPEADRPELLVLYSSAITVFGGIGEGDYCAANSVLDAYASALSAAAPTTRVLSVAWGPWQHDDWQAEGPGSALAARVREHRETYGFTDEGGCALLDRLAGTAHGPVLAVRHALAEGMRAWDEVTALDEVTGAATAQDRTRFPRPALRADYVAPRTALERALAEIWGRHLGIDQVGVHDPFFDLGGNSLVGLAVMTATEQQTERSFPPALLFAHPTVAELAAALDGATTATAMTTAQDLGSARGRRRRRARDAQSPLTRNR
ncbi:SDR family NAD(P)-dependent oxidoreductase [Streptomyces sp. NBC_00846]|uniref:type I polyketide synthase n=1 Tax=Streptomyces sp. NBC_00846 TaxID=2975849 RepID=UPI003864D8D2|nr:SDR family NAD(P)-dependent oxidoreductase [Streptomyces sp. NBC_00846]